MYNTIIIKRDTPTHLLTYWMGVLAGLGIDYSLNRGSQLYMALNERRRERYLKTDIERGDLVLERVCDGITVLTGKGYDNAKLEVRYA